MSTHTIRYAIGGAVLLLGLATILLIRYQGAEPGQPTHTTPEPTPPTEEAQNYVSVSYSDGTTVVPATYRPAGESVTFTHPNIGTLTLPKAMSASGVRYANADESVVFWEHQDELTITKDGVEIFRGPLETKVRPPLTEGQARVIAEKSCIKAGESLGSGFLNENTHTWWFDVSLVSAPEGCNPACVVSEETNSAEINWRCTGLILPDTPPTSTTECSCPTGYRKDGNACTPECYYATPRCLTPSFICGDVQ